MTLNSTDRFRLIVKLWLFASIAGVIWNLVPVFATSRADQQTLAELEEQRRHPPMATVDVAEDSPWPDSTILMKGQPVAGLDDANLPSAHIQYGRLGRMVVAHRSVSVINASMKLPEVICSFPDRSDTETLFAAAISGDGKVIAAVDWSHPNGPIVRTFQVRRQNVFSDFAECICTRVKFGNWNFLWTVSPWCPHRAAVFRRCRRSTSRKAYRRTPYQSTISTRSQIIAHNE
jgi:hypothetical protein